MGDWLHCNTCFKQPGQGDGRHYYLTGCGHIYCELCQDKGWKERCLLCDTPRPSVLKLSSNLTPPVDAFFSDPIRKIKKICSDMKQLLATIDFQNGQRRHFVIHLQKCVSNQEMIVQQHDKELKSKISAHFEHMQKENSKLREAVATVNKMMKENHQVHFRENTKLREENAYMRRLLSENCHSPLRSPSGERIRSPAQKVSGYGTPSPYHQMPRVTSTSNLIGGSKSAAQMQQSPLRSPSGERIMSPAHRISGYGTPSPYHEMPRVSSTSSHLALNKSGGHGITPVASGKVVARTPPSTNKMGNEQRRTPTNSKPLGQTKSSVQGMSLVTPGRISIRTPPSGGKMGTIPCTPQMRYTPLISRPKSAPHPVMIV